MLRRFLRAIAINTLGIFIAANILSGLIYYSGGFQTLVITAIVILAANIIVRPIINLLLLPIHLITLGFFRWVANCATLYLVTWIVPDILIHSYTFPGMNLDFVVVPPIHFSAFGSYLLATALISLLFHFLYWLFED